MITNSCQQIGLLTESRGVDFLPLNLIVTSVFVDFLNQNLLINIENSNSLNAKIDEVKVMSNRKYSNFYGIVYCTINLINGKFYIGKTTYNDSDYLGSGKILKKAIKKYGKVNFKRKILCICYNKKELDFAEIYLIKKYQAYKSINGYNLTKGGEGAEGLKRTQENKDKISIAKKGKPSTMLGKKHKEKTKKIMSLSAKGKPKSEITKRKLSEINKGKKETKETKEKISESLKLAYKEGRHKGSKGYKHTEDYKKYMSSITKGRKHKLESIEKMKRVQKGKIISKKQRLFLSNLYKDSRKMTEGINTKIVFKDDINDYLNNNWNFCKIRNGELIILTE